MTLVGRGLSNDEIAEQLVPSRLCVKNHANRVMMKLNVRDRPSWSCSLRNGLVKLGQR